MWTLDPGLLGEFQDLAGEMLLEFNVDTCIALGCVHALGILKQNLIKETLLCSLPK